MIKLTPEQLFAAAKKGIKSSEERVVRAETVIAEVKATLAEAQRQHTSAKVILKEWQGKLAALPAA